MARALSMIISAFVLVLALFIGVAVVDSFVETTGTGNDDVTRQAALLGDNGQYVTLDDGVGRQETVYKTTGYAVNLTGSDTSYVQSDGSFDIATDDNWTVSVWGYVEDASATKNMSALSVDGRVLITYNGSANQWQAWYYEDGGRNSYVVNVSASGNEAGNFTNIQVWHNGTHVAIYRNNTQGELKNVTGDSIVDAPVAADNWDGRLEEVRTFDRALDATNRSALVSAPVEQRPDFEPTSRIMFDQPDRATQVILYAPATLQTSNVTYSQGFAEQIVDEGDFAAMGADYKWDTSGPKIAPIAGGELDGAPVAYASYSFGGSGTNSLLDGFGTAVSMAALIPIIGIMLVILARVQSV